MFTCTHRASILPAARGIGFRRPWELTTEGVSALQIGNEVFGAKPVLQRAQPDQQEGASKYQLFLELESTGWEHFVVGGRSTSWPRKLYTPLGSHGTSTAERAPPVYLVRTCRP